MPLVPLVPAMVLTAAASAVSYPLAATGCRVRSNGGIMVDTQLVSRWVTLACAMNAAIKPP
jgi:hypothetical protein